MNTWNISAGRCTTRPIIPFSLAATGTAIGVALAIIALQGVLGAPDTLSFIATLSGGGALAAMSVGWGVLLLIFRPFAKKQKEVDPLYLAISNEDEGAVRGALASRNCDVNKMDEADGMTPLHKAVRKSNREIVNILVEHGADVNATDREGNTPLHYVNTRSMAELLTNADVNIPNNQGTTPLHRAVANNNTPLTNWLIQKGAYLWPQDKLGNTPLHLAPNRLLAENFKDKGTDEVRNKAGETPLHTSVQNKADQVIDWLLKQGADVEAEDKLGNTPLHLAPSALEAEKLTNAKVNARNKADETPLHIAAREGRETMVRWLCRRGADFNAKDKAGRTPLECTQKESNVYLCLKRLIEQKEEHKRRSDESTDSDLEISEEDGWIMPNEFEIQKPD